MLYETIKSGSREIYFTLASKRSSSMTMKTRRDSRHESPQRRGNRWPPKRSANSISDARRRFGKLLIKEVSHTISNVTPELLGEELRDLDLLRYVKALLPDAIR